MKQNNSLQDNNQLYLTLFNEGLRLSRTVDGENAVDEYTLVFL